MTVLDASALLAFLNDEDGADVVERRLEQGDAVVGVANWSEVAQRIMARGPDWPMARDVLLGYGLFLEPVTRTDAEVAASLWQRGSGLSLGDRLCLALASRLDAEVLTADRAWRSMPGVVLIR